MEKMLLVTLFLITLIACQPSTPSTHDSIANTTYLPPQGNATASEPRQYPLTAHGHIRVLVFEVEPSGYYDNAEIECCYAEQCTGVDAAAFNKEYCVNLTKTQYFNRHNSKPGMPSIYDIKKWYEDQAKEYNVTDLNITIQIVGPYTIPDRFAYGFDPNAAVADYFKKLFLEKGYNRAEFDIVHYVYFDDFSYNPKTNTSGFRSFAHRQEGETFNDVIANPNAIVTILHEMGHTFNGDDLYNGYICQVPDGIAEPNAKPIYPQRYGCIMCPAIMLNATASLQPGLLSQIKTCYSTAKKFGWS